MSELIYCDHAATSFPKPVAVAEAVAAAMTLASASPGRSAHHMSLEASRTVFRAREAVADVLGVEDSSRIAFTLNVTQALNTALNGLLQPGDHVLTTSMEHNSVMRPLAELAERLGVSVEVVPGSGGPADPEAFRSRRRANTRLAVVNHASNVTGVINPLAEIKRALNDVIVLADAAQSAGTLPLSPAAEFADIIAFTGHKGLLGPTGTGGLWVRPGLEVAPLVRGGTGSRSEHETHPDFMPDALEAGTPNTHGLAGLAAGASFVMDTGIDRIRAHELGLTRRFLDGLSRVPGVQTYGPPPGADRVAVVSLNLNGRSPSDLARTLDRDHGIMTRPGLHCSPRAHRTLGSFPGGTVRFSFGWANTEDQIDRVLTVLDELARRPFHP